MTKKTMKVVDEGKQLAVRIPKEFVDKHKVTSKKHFMEWESKGRKLKGELKKK